MSAPKSCLDKSFKYDTAAQSREPNYLRDKFKAMQKPKEAVPNVSPSLVRAKIK